MDTSTIKYLTVEEFTRLMSVIDNPRDRALFLIAYRHGMRACEVSKLRMDDIDLRGGTIYVKRRKGSRANRTDMMSDEISALKAHLATKRLQSANAVFTSRFGSPFHPASLSFLMRKYGRKARLPVEKCHFHVLKHSIATHLLGRTGNIRFVQSWIGHKDIKNTAIYADLTPETFREEAKSAFAKLPKYK